MHTQTTIWLMAAALMMLGACGDAGDSADDDGNNGFVDNTPNNSANNDAVLEGPFESFAERPCPTDNILTADNFGAPFMANWCNGCHHSSLPAGTRAGAPIGVDFDTMDGIELYAEIIWLRTADQNEGMPPAGGPSDEERRMLGQWLACEFK